MEVSKLQEGKKLTKNIVLAKSRSESIASIKKLNLWGQGVTDVNILKQMPELEIVSLSANKISDLSCFRACSRLQELYLRSNQVKDLNEIAHLCYCSHLNKLWLAGNPCATHPQYRETVIKHLPSLTHLDDKEIVESERQEAARNGLDLIIKEEDNQINDQENNDQDLNSTLHSIVTIEDEEDNSISSNLQQKQNFASEEDLSSSSSSITATTSTETCISLTSTIKLVPTQAPFKKAQLVSSPIKNNVAAPTEDENDAADSKLEQLKETNKIREELGMKPVPLSKLSSPVRTIPDHRNSFDSDVRCAVLQLVNVLNDESLIIVRDVIQERLKMHMTPPSMSSYRKNAYS